MLQKTCRRGGLEIIALDLGSKGLGSSLEGHCVMFLGRTLWAQDTFTVSLSTLEYTM